MDQVLKTSKKHARCILCSKKFYDSLFFGYWCPVKEGLIQLTDLACPFFHYHQADLNPNWKDDFTFGEGKI